MAKETLYKKTFACASDICATLSGGIATLPAMAEDVAAGMGRRIRELMEARGIDGPTALHNLLISKLLAAGVKRIPTRQTISNWVGGQVVPTLELLPYLADVLGEDQEWLLFGSKRRDQLRKERQYLSRVSEEEAELLTMFRESSKTGQKMILKLVKGVSEENPAPEAEIHQLRRKGDKQIT